MNPRILPVLCLLAAALTLRAAEPGPVPRFTHPGAGQTFYFVLTDRFANGNPANDTGGFPGGTEEHGFDPTRIGYFHGGDFAGLTAKLDYLKALGTTAVWVTPPFQNKPVQSGSAAYHGYWVTDFLKIDPHLGTNDDFRAFVAQAHARGLKVYMDIIVNHTADVIHFPDNRVDYLDAKTHPLRDGATGAPLTERSFAYNGLGDTARPPLSAERSFPHRPVVPAAEKSVKNPAWLNDPVFYHNRGNSAFRDESSVHGDFVGLDDVFTEHPRVVQGMIEIFSSWVKDYGVDGFRIDTARHVNGEFWQAFGPAIRAAARAAGRPAFIQFGEVAVDDNVDVLSEFSTLLPLDTTLDFGFFTAARRFVAKAGPAAALTDLFQRDDLYTDHDSNIHTTTTFIGNHDAGRFGYFLQQDNPGAPPALLAELMKLGHGLLYLSRGQPVVYYGDEQGMVGRGGNDMQAREDMFPSQAPDFRAAPLLATTRTGADDKFDPAHPFYQFFAKLAALRAAHPALRTGAMLLRDSGEPGLFAFSRIERGEKVEYLVALNNSRREKLSAALPTSQPAGATFRLLFDSRTGTGADAALATDAAGRLAVALDPLQFAVWRAAAPLAAQSGPLRVALVNPADGATLAFSQREYDGHLFPTRQEIRAEVGGNDGFAEVTFVLQRASRPGQYELLGTDDAAPYRVFWRPPPDLAPGEQLTFTATVTDLRGRTASAGVTGVKVAPAKFPFGIVGATVPVIQSAPPATVALAAGNLLTLRVAAEGTGPLEYQWIRDEAEISGGTDAVLNVTTPGRYVALVRNRAGTVFAPATIVTADPVAALPGARVETHAALPSKFVPPRRVDVWLPPGYDANPAERYPVIYMHDGQNLFDLATSYGHIPWSADTAMARLMASGRTRGAIIVGIWNTQARFAEYLPQKAVPDAAYETLVKQFNLTRVPPRGDDYLKYLVTELKPFIDRTYRTRPEREHTSTMGSSMGGLISAYAICEYPEVFGGAGCVSIHWPLGDGVIIDWFARHLPRPGVHRIYFDFGTETLDAAYEPYQRRVDDIMRAAGYREGRDWLTGKFHGALHSERSWRERVDIPLSFLLAR
ncbi:MAG TPA: alpha-amylase family glycosyl hydrolase [Lacunisphaera sp.]